MTDFFAIYKVTYKKIFKEDYSIDQARKIDGIVIQANVMGRSLKK
jgi:hypothetical protein